MIAQQDSSAAEKGQPAGNDPFDDGTVCDDAESLFSHADSAVDSEIDGPAFHLSSKDGQKPVYEAWAIRRTLNPRTDSAWRCLGVKIAGSIRTEHAIVYPERFEQSELAEMHLHALEEFQAKHRRGWASRVFKKGKTYERDLDKRCRELPLGAQEQLFNLLENRSLASSTRYRTRTWSVVVMKKRDRYRFAQNSLAESKGHDLRFWKNTFENTPEMLDYFIVIRGSETKASTERGGFTEPDKSENPWMRIDQAECRRKADHDRTSRVGRRRWRSPLSYRDFRDRSPMSESEPDTSRHQSPPSYRTQRDYSPISEPEPEPEPEIQARRYIRITRESGRSVPPMVPMAPPPVFGGLYPSPPRTPSPVSYSHSYQHSIPFHRPRVPYVEEDIAWHGDHGAVPPPPPPPPMIRPSVSIYAPQHFGIHEGDTGNGFDEPRIANRGPVEPCIACRAIPDCGHFNRDAACERPVSWYGDAATHPPCFICMATTPEGPAGFGSSGPNAPVPLRRAARERSVSATPRWHGEELGHACVCDSGSFLWPARPDPAHTSPPNPPLYPLGGRGWNDGGVDDDAYAPTEIETDDGRSDDERSDDGDITAVEDVPQPKEG